jgi:hypothetical protein
VAVDYEDRALGHTRVAFDVIPPYAVGGDQLALEVADELERQAAQLGGERLMREDRIDADSVDAYARGDRLVVP